MYSHEQINDTGWDLLSYIISDSAKDPGLDYTTAKNIVPAVAYGKKELELTVKDLEEQIQ